MQVNCDIACPGFRRWVKGFYDVDSSGKYLVNAEGRPITERTYCFNEGNTCPHDTCMLHRAGRGTIAPNAVRLYPNSYEKVPLRKR